MTKHHEPSRNIMDHDETSQITINHQITNKSTKTTHSGKKEEEITTILYNYSKSMFQMTFCGSKYCSN